MREKEGTPLGGALVLLLALVVAAASLLIRVHALLCTQHVIYLRPRT